jgi:hypothetical protein
VVPTTRRPADMAAGSRFWRLRTFKTVRVQTDLETKNKNRKRPTDVLAESRDKGPHVDCTRFG